MNSYTLKIVGFFIVVFFLVFVSSQFYLAVNDNYTTTTAYSYSAIDDVTFKGVFVRDENVINYNGGGVIGYSYSDGSKISKDSVIAYVYSDEDEIITRNKIEKLERELASLEMVSSPGTSDVAQPELISKLIAENYKNAVYCIEKSDYESFSDEREALLEYMNIMALVTKKEKDYNAEIERLRSEIERLKSTLSNPIDTVSTDIPGYFVSYVDGYEEQLSVDNIHNITAGQIKKIAANPVSPNASGIGKIVDGYDWKLLGVIDNSANKYYPGMKIELNFNSCSETISATIDEIIATDNPSESIFVISSDKLTFELVQHRVERIQMVVSKYDGVYVPRSAIRFNAEGEKGVYVMMGQNIVFKKLDIIFEDADFVLSSNTGASDYVLLYDEIILEGVSASAEKTVQTLEGEEDPPEETTVTTTGISVGTTEKSAS
ncbi:MAG: hypothetical protein E7507_01495 [Ruminococcus sp.]|nr:hypothetical protein [Ruminococcus sp.]